MGYLWWWLKVIASLASIKQKSFIAALCWLAVSVETHVTPVGDSVEVFHRVSVVVGANNSNNDHISQCQCNIVVCTILKKVVCTVHTTILHRQENPMCTYDVFHLQFHKCYLLSEYKLWLKQCRILCHLRIWKLSKSTILIFWAIASFWRKSYVVRLYCTNQKIPNVATNGAYDYIALTQRFLLCLFQIFQSGQNTGYNNYYHCYQESLFQSRLCSMDVPAKELSINP